MILVVKCGGPEEQGKPKAGNRGKRDSQLILMNFFSRVTYNDRMTPLDYDLFQKITYLMNATPDYFELCLMVCIEQYALNSVFISNKIGAGFARWTPTQRSTRLRCGCWSTVW